MKNEMSDYLKGWKKKLIKKMKNEMSEYQKGEKWNEWKFKRWKMKWVMTQRMNRLYLRASLPPTEKWSKW